MVKIKRRTSIVKCYLANMLVEWLSYRSLEINF